MPDADHGRPGASIRARRRTAIALRSCVAVGVIGSAVIATTSPAAADAAVNIIGFSFNPSSVTINRGASVTWTMSDPGTPFAYPCNVHSSLHGTVVMQTAATPTSTPSTSSSPPNTPARAAKGSRRPKDAESVLAMKTIATLLLILLVGTTTAAATKPRRVGR